MKSILLKILKIFLISMAVLLAVLLIFGVALILGWPWWVGFFILIGIFGLVLGSIFLRKLWLRRREQRFVSQVIEQDDRYLKQMGDKEKERFKELQDRWKEAITALRHSHLKKYGNPLYVLPWYLVIGESGSGKTTAIQSARLSSPFAETNRTSGISGTRNCDWWFFEQAIVIDTAGRFAIPVDEGRDKDEWQKFLTHLVKYRKKEPLNGLVVTVSADKLLESGAEALEMDGKRIRQRIDELMRVLHAKFPTYVLVTKCDLVQGMNQFCDRLSEKSADQAMGVINTSRDRKVEAISFLDQVISGVGERLRDYRLLVINQPSTHQVYSDASQAQGIDPALLLFPEEFERLRAGLAAFISGGFQENPFQESPFLRGVYFSSGRQEGTPYSHFLSQLGLIAEKEVLPGTNKGLFLHDFFAKILPADRGLFAPTQGARHWNRLTRNLGLMAWLAVGIALCGLLSYSFVKNLRTIREVTTIFNQESFLSEQDRYGNMMMLTDFQEKTVRVIEQNRSWWIPRFGLHQNEKVEVGLKQKYCDRFHSVILNPFDEQVKIAMADFSPSTSGDVIGDYITHLIRRINLLSAAKKRQGLKKLLAKPRPPYLLTSASVDPAITTKLQEMFGNLYVYFLEWRSDSNQIDLERHDLQNRLNYIVTELRTNMRWLVDWANAQDSISSVILQDFWTLSPLGVKQPGVAPAFTAHGKQRIEDFITELESALPSGPPKIARQKLDFQAWYRNEYFQAWRNFSAVFHSGGEDLKDAEKRRQTAIGMGTDQNPYFKLLGQMAGEIEPVAKEKKELPTWVKQVYAFNAIRYEAQGLQKMPSKEPGIIRKTTTKVKSKLARLERETGLQAGKYLNPGQKIIAAQTFSDYQNGLSAVAKESTPRETAYRMATSLYKEDPDTGASSYFKAQRAVKKLVSVMPTSASESKIVGQLIGGPLDYLQAYINDEAACYLQHLWEREVLWEVRSTTDGYDKIQQLLGEKGYAKAFVEDGSAAPFVAKSLKKGYYAKRVKGLSLPFETGFFSFLNKSVVVSEPSPEYYAVTIRGIPTHANPNARILPHATRLELQCGKNVQRLVNRQYPIKRIFNWSRENCGDVRLQILVGDLVLTQYYSGKQAFVEFLRDFAKGAHRFLPDDFPAERADLISYGIKEIKVGYHLAGHRKIINPPGPSPANVPERIVRCWSP
jgi:type VI secretion system protein ImpL